MEPAINMSARSLQYYVIGKHWASDLEFFRIETAFLHRLLDNYLTGPLDKINVTQLSTTGIKLYQLERYEARVNTTFNLNDHVRIGENGYYFTSKVQAMVLTTKTKVTLYRTLTV